VAFEIIVIGASFGGLSALQVLLSGLPEMFALPIVIVQHRGRDAEPDLCAFLGARSRLPLSEPEDKEPIQTGHAYLAPCDYHLLVEDRSFALSTAPSVSFARPSIDVLFESVANEYREHAMGVILTGANRDGAHGLSRIKSVGGLALVEDPASATCGEMPRAAIAVTNVDRILPLQDIAPFLQTLGNSMAKRYGT
jgi:two-component system chemotaxis response regulator CheB